jgi:hypothetical protein
MKKLLTFLALVSLTVAAAAQTETVLSPVKGVSVNAGFDSKLIEQGAVTGTNYITAGIGLDVYSVDLAVETFSRYNGLTKYSTATVAGKSVTTASTDASGLKRTYLTAGYVFTSGLANLTLGAQLRHTQGTETLVGGLSNDTLPFVKLDGKLFGGSVVWDGIALNDSKNRSNNYEANLRLPIGVGYGLKVVPAVGLGFNDPGAPTIAALKLNKKYADAGLGLAWKSLEADLFVQRGDITSSASQVTGYTVGYSYKF